MSEVQSRSSASRGRVSARGGRGGYSSRGGRGGSSRSAKADTSEDTFASEDEGELGQMKKKYANTLPMLKELFPDWTDEDLVFALEEVDGDLEQAIDRITEGNVSQWGEVKKKTTEKKQPKAKEVSTAPIETTAISARAGRGRGGFEGRGRARGDRGRGGRGGRGGVVHANGSRPEKSAVTTTTTTTTTAAPETPATALPETKTTVEAEPEPAAAEPAETGADASKASVGPKKGWASLFAKPAPPPPQKAPAAPVPTAAPVPPPVPAPAEKPAAPEPVVEKKEPEKAPIPVAAPAPVPVPVEKGPEPVIPKQSNEAPVAPAPVPAPKDDLTRNNLAQIPDVSPPAPTATAASTVGSHFDQATQVASTPSRQPAGGVPTSAFKQTPRGAAARRVMEQQEAVVMPGNHAVDRAAVQFGSMGLNGDSTEVDIDENREDAETRAQPPQHSPVAPRASLPPSTQHQAPAETPVVPRPAPGLPPVPQTSAADSSFDFARYTDAQKPYDPFTQPVTQPQPQIQEPFANQAPVQPTVTTNSDFTPFYSMDQRLPYNYYGGYSQSQDASLAQRAAAGFGVSGAEVQPHVPTTQPPGRYGHVEAPNSGHTTPNPTLPGATQTPTAQHMPGQQSAHAAYGYGYPYYSNPHYASYMSQMTQHQYGRNRPMYDDARRYDDHYMPHSNQYGYGSQYAPYGKGGMYNQPQGFSYDHSSSPATAGSFNQAMPGRDSMYGGRTGSAQPSETQQTAAGSTAFGSGMSDVFGRSPAGFGQNQPMSQQPPVTAEEAPKSFDTPKAAGPSPSLAQANRPGSAANNVPGQPQAQTSLPPLQAQQAQQGFGGYPQLGPQYGAGLGSLGAHQGGAGSQSHHQASGYGNYGGAAGFANYYGNSGRGGWAGNYTH